MSSQIPHFRAREMRLHFSWCLMEEIEVAANAELFQDPVEISEAQLNQFRDLIDVIEDGFDIEPESDNFRPMQPLNGRDLLLVFASANNLRMNILGIIFPALTLFAHKGLSTCQSRWSN